MKTGLNQFEVIGNLTEDAKLARTLGDVPVANFTVAVNTTYRDKQDKQQEQTDWVKVSMFGKRAESLEKYLTKGLAVRVAGRASVGKPWNDGGEWRADLVLTVGRGEKDFMFLGGGRSSAGNDNETVDVPPADDALFPGE